MRTVLEMPAVCRGLLVNCIFFLGELLECRLDCARVTRGEGDELRRELGRLCWCTCCGGLVGLERFAFWDLKWGLVSCSVREWQELNYVDSVVPADLERWAVRWVLFLRETMSKRRNGMVVCSLLGRAWCCRS